MDKDKIIEQYNANDVTVNDDFIGWLRSDHAGETGAVWIYKGASLAFWSDSIRKMALEHGETEKQHLVVMNHLLPSKEKSRLIFLWKIMGFSLGFISSIFGFRTFCFTINVVETFVEKHYGEQLKYLEERGEDFGLSAVLRLCCEEEVVHKKDAADKCSNIMGNRFMSFWGWIVENSSNLAVLVAKKI
ncbi:demethoxyubiquinone hydroxylase family protein [Betaproteobacteria bacterium]|nr:demethoxyubiquinone hydroxylase family protein [Betaproteobacteria bacterium]